jgi:hypothetical protein
MTIPPWVEDAAYVEWPPPRTTKGTWFLLAKLTTVATCWEDIARTTAPCEF